jgi:hypothetical protein
MKNRPPSVLTRIFLAILHLLVGASLLPAQTTTITRTWTLVPGWNSIFVDVDPVSDSPATVFSGLPIDQVWAYFPTATPLEYISNPADGLWNVAGWNVYLPPSVPDAAIVTNLFAIKGGQGYLIKNTSASNATLSIVGTPNYRALKWAPDSFTHTGLPVDPATTVRAGDYFAASTAHKLQARYRLLATGAWIPLADTAPIVDGQAYWIYTKGSSDFSSPVQLGIEGDQRLDYSTSYTERTLTVTNKGTVTTTVTLTNPGSLPLVVLGPNLTAPLSERWVPLTSYQFTLTAGQSLPLLVGLKRKDMGAALNGLLNLSAQGVALKVPVTAVHAISVELVTPVGGLEAPVGLWVGQVTLDKVSEPNSATPNALTATPAEFTMRLIIHVSSAGNARLLKDVIIMRQPFAVEEDGAPQLVLVTDQTRIPLYKSTTLRDGSPFSSRLSSIAYDFAGTELPLAGSFYGTLTGNIVIGRDLPTNPFKHRYHPDHDDKDANFQALPAGLPADKEEVWAVNRQISMAFSAVSASDNTPNNGFAERKGTYEETITGIHKNTVKVGGTFLLRRLNTIGQLNPEVTPAP